MIESKTEVNLRSLFIASDHSYTEHVLHITGYIQFILEFSNSFGHLNIFNMTRNEPIIYTKILTLTKKAAKAAEAENIFLRF